MVGRLEWRRSLGCGTDLRIAEPYKLEKIRGEGEDGAERVEWRGEGGLWVCKLKDADVNVALACE